MRLCFLAGANSIHSYRWIKYFSTCGYEVIWISLSKSIFEPIEGVEYYEMKLTKNPINLLRIVLKIRKLLKKIAPDVLHVHSVGTYGLVGLLTYFQPVVATPWGSDVIFGKNKLLRRLIISNFLRRAHLITCDAFHIKADLLAMGVEKDRIRIINFGIDTERFAPSFEDNSGGIEYSFSSGLKIISLRNFEPLYDLKTLVQAIPDVLKAYKNVEFILIGKGSQESELKSLVKSLGVSEKVSFPGFVSNDALPNILSRSDIYVSTSLSDAGIAASTAEAMSCELPVVITNTGENENWINDGINGYLVASKNPKALSKKLITAIEDLTARKRVGQEGRKTILEFNDYNSEMSKMKKLYDLVLSNAET